MSVRIRLSRSGSKKRPYYHIVAADSRSPRDGRYIEKLGAYNPLLPQDCEQRLVLDQEKVKAWLSKGAQPTETVAYLIKNCNPDGTLNYKKKDGVKLSKKAQAKKAAEEEAKKAAEEAKKAEEEAKKAEEATEETPAEA